MDASIAKNIVEAAAEIGLEVTLHKNYSGRGMYGSTCSGVVGSMDDIIQCIALVSFNKGEAGESADFIENFKGLRTDNMGRSDIIVY